MCETRRLFKTLESELYKQVCPVENEPWYLEDQGPGTENEAAEGLCFSDFVLSSSALTV